MALGLYISSGADELPACGPMLNGSTSARSLSTKGIMAKLEKSGHPISSLSLKISNFDAPNRDQIATDIQIFKSDLLLGTISLSRLSENAYATHVQVSKKNQGQGIGTLLYLVAARYVRDHLKSSMYSSSSPSTQAAATWQRMVKEGWAQKNFDEFGEDHWAVSIIRFKFDLSLFDTGFAPETLPLLQRAAP